MAIIKIGKSHRARKMLFQRGLRRGFLTIQEIEAALPSGTLTPAERWLLYYSLRAAEIEVRDEKGALVSVPALTAAELAALAEEAEGEETPETAEQVREAEEALASMEEPAPEHH
jgi:hypothetical protein